jgi:molybdenum cofactor guanylyltransferase
VTRLLGAVLAGGQSRRFGSDKAMALWRGRTLLDWAVEALRPHVETVAICGRAGGLDDRPPGRLGPLAGVNAALHHGAAAGFDAVLTLPCDTPSVDVALLDRLARSDGAAYAEAIPVIGLWPCRFADALDAHLLGDDRSMRSWTRRIGAEPVALGEPPANVNFLEDLRLLDQPQG